MIEDNYEISLWEDYLYNPDNSEATRASSYYKERKIAVIGSNTMTSTCRAINPVLIEGVNGTRTFSFKMYYKCREDSYTEAVQQLFAYDSNEQDYGPIRDSDNKDLFYETKSTESRIYKNPFLKLLVNERKVKVKWKGQWYDFVINGCEENSSDKSITYTCEDAFINELSKTGFNIELNDDLQNNQGTMRQLAAEVLKNTDWTVLNADTSFLKEKREDAVYELILTHSINVVSDLNSQTTTIQTGNKILLYFTQVQEKCKKYLAAETNLPLSDNYIQFAYALNYEREESSHLVTNAEFFHLTGEYKVDFDSDNIPLIFTLYDSNGIEAGAINLNEGVSNNYRAEYLVRKQMSILDTRTGKYCDIYQAKRSLSDGSMMIGDTIYGYKSVEYRDPTVVNNVITNSKNFASTNGWMGDGADISFKLYNPPNSDIYESVLQLTKGGRYYNNGLSLLSSYIPDGFANGEQFVFRYRARFNTGLPVMSVNPLLFQVRQYTYNGETGNITLDEDSPSYFDDNLSTLIDLSGGWTYQILTCNRSATRSDIYENKVGFFITVRDDTGVNFNSLLLEEAQFFKLCYDSKGTIICPGEIDKDSVASIIYTYFNHSRTPLNVEAEDILKLWESTEDWNYGDLLEPVYNRNFEKIRAISAKQSNCLNLLQSLAEIFECRLEFYVPHEENGGLIYYEGVDQSRVAYGHPRKYINILPLEGEKIGFGFIYGIDLKEIRRSIKSNQIVTKMIVLPNASEYATNGVCAIEKSLENYPRTNFILNFDYYISQGFLNREDLYNDLYNTDYIGYYYWLNKYNTQYDEITEDLIYKKQELSRLQSYLTVYNSAIAGLNEQIQTTKDELMKILNMTWEEVEDYISNNYDNPESISEPVLTRITAYINLSQQLSEYVVVYDRLNSSIQEKRDSLTNLQSIQASILDAIKEKDLAFYRKYSQFIKEGCWSGKEYINDDLYYFDAVKNARISSYPVVSYDISVMRVSALEEFKNKVFKVGDISFIQDTEFFGYTLVNGVKTPYKEKITISEIVSNFDEPEKDVFRVQNYKTEFEDLFQRLNSTLQNLQFSAIKDYRR